MEQHLEINVVDFWKLMIKSKWIIVSVTFFITVLSLYFINNKTNEIALFKGELAVEIGHVLNQELMPISFSVFSDIETNVKNQYDILIKIVHKNPMTILLTAKNNDKMALSKNLEDAFAFIVKRHKKHAEPYKHYFMTKKIGKLIVKSPVVDTHNKFLYYLVSFFLGLIISIIIVLGINFLKEKIVLIYKV